MRAPNTFHELDQVTLFRDPIVPLLITGLLWSSSPYQVEVVQVIAAFLLAYIPWMSYCDWKRSDRREFPLIAFVLAMYWLAYALPLFWGERKITGFRGGHSLSDLAITKSMFLAVEGSLALLFGTVLARRLAWFPSTKIDIPQSRTHRRYLGLVLIGGLVLRVFVPIDNLGSGVRQVLNNVETIVPAVAFGLLFRYWLRGEATRWDQTLVVAYLSGSVVLGIASGWLGSVVSIGIVCAAIYAYERHRLPVVALLVVLPVVLFFQPAKQGFRERFWYSSLNAGVSDRLWFWLDDSWRMWSQAIDDPGSEGIKELANSALGRLSLLQQTANVIDLTPSVVPYQYFKLYSYLGVTFIPRFLWPDKPSVNDANIWYQVSYGLTPASQLQNVSIAVGTLTESYISFGWLGPALIMTLMGILLAMFQRFFLRINGGLVLSTLGAVLLPQFLAIESQLAQYMAGIVQQIAVAILVLLPVLNAYKALRCSSRTITVALVPSRSRPSVVTNAANRL